jgi:hypothetical protein
MMSVLFGSARNRQSTTQHTLPMCYFLYAKMALFLQVVLIKVLLMHFSGFICLGQWARDVHPVSQ